ncbi:PREDICTED: uncharacterized protein LOC109486111 isoform X1 [Branchiostoma belcheri]|uniref:Uncharacterized protein LOC109486111 isoform X1 n=2 Tax=Branchiostoma belcheri TaxID=7741 RepID=A0A6P5AGA3_BRABE|nr:PREDICTED: uncharacterized protein LOC109486111 isoform X1 [Branchiostoma belcheri]
MAVRSSFADIIKVYDIKRERLLQLYQESQRFIHDNFAHHSAFQSLLCDDKEPLMTELQRRKDILQSQIYQVVFLGTHNSGKSTTINMLLGTELLPKALRHCTDVNCEVRYGEQKKALIYNMSELVNEVSLDVQNPNKVLAGYVRHDKNKDVGNLYDKVEIYWPADLLQSGLVLVDTPGVDIVAGHDSGLWDTYGTRAVTAVFVLDGGYFGNETQIQNLIRSFSNMPDEAAIFTINKWDIVVEDSDSSSESEQVSADEYTRRCDSLKEAWPRLDVENQVLCTRAKEALQHRKSGRPSDDCTKLLAHLETSFGSSLTTRVKEHTQWLVQFLQKAAEIFEKCLNIPDSRGQKTGQSEVAQRYKDGLRRCELKQEITKHLKGKVNLGIKDLSLKLRDFLVAEKGALVENWKPNDDQLPDIGGFDDLEDLIRRLVVRKMCDIVREWDKKTDLLKTFELNIVSEFKDQFCLMKNELERILQMRDVSDSQTSSKLRTIDNLFVLPALMFQSLPTVMAAILNALLFPVAIGKDVLGRRREKKEYTGTAGTATSVLDQRREYVRRKLNGILTEILNKEHYYNIIRECFQPAVDLNELVKLIPQIKTFLQDQITQIEENQFPMLKDQLIHRLADVRLFEATEVRQYSLHVPTSISWEDSDDIGEGSFSKVYKATMSRGDMQSGAVAVKVPKLALEVNIMDYLNEEDILTQLNADCIVKFYGTAIDRRANPVQLVMVFELCSCTLRERLLQELNPAPADCTRQDKVQAMLCAADLAKQTASALRYLHDDKDVVHRDLKLDNIFVKDDPSGLLLKLGDVGVAKFERKIQGSRAGTDLYMAPEVLQRSPVYDRKVDIYSFAFVLWELWYGRQADHGHHLSDSEFRTAVVTRNLRPAVIEDLPSPECDWMKLIQECWEGDAKMRPSADQCVQRLNSIIDKINTETP